MEVKFCLFFFVFIFKKDYTSYLLCVLIEKSNWLEKAFQPENFLFDFDIGFISAVLHELPDANNYAGTLAGKKLVKVMQILELWYEN